MLAQMVGFFASWFTDPSFIGIGLAIVFGAIWLTAYWPPLFVIYWLWAVMVSSAMLTLSALSFMQIPLEIGISRVLNHFLGQDTLMGWRLLLEIPAILLSGLVQEGSKLLPVVVFWWCSGRDIDPKLGLAVGAVAGAGFGVFEAVWVHNTIFAADWSWQAVQAGGLAALAPFWERFFTVASHMAWSSLAGYGLAKCLGWQFYLLASLLHAFNNYGVLLVHSALLSLVEVAIFVSVMAVLVTTWALWWRWRRQAGVSHTLGITSL